ncbi:hypothetical protein SAMN04488550_4142 [Gordonia malaquae]|uniref:Uncharacterized protein n=1 Tax=Gordonia malaquae NBRC 108250 TaxID=1223542 RepID=M3UZ76_GORML|nr:hypothetical protein [Gordonia malaquae]GAC81242.1 hypothetical protein GM1_030_00710 [Gordonia malaquae NBRC 108250]SEE24929.1 hypothetical protein SAMN04488550_4142 [Gordonia malaquae]
MIDTDDPQHWPGDSGAVIEACVPTDELLAQIVNEAAWVALFQLATALQLPDIMDALMEVTADDIHQWRTAP